MRLTVKDVAVRLGVNEKTVVRWAEEDGLPCSKVDGAYRFQQAALLEWATGRGIQLPARLLEETQILKPRPLPSVTDALREGGILEKLACPDRRTALAAMVEKLPLPKGVDRPGLVNVLMAREMLGSTGVGDGIAIPHVRNPIVLRVTKPVVMIGLLEPPIDFGAIDKKPVHTLFLMVSPTTRAHLHLLSRLGWLLQDPTVREALVKRAPAARIRECIERAEAKIADVGNKEARS